MFTSAHFGALSLLSFGIACEAASFSPILPPSYPLAVRNPYLSTWLPGSLTSDFTSSEPQFWYGNNLTWSIAARVGGQIYSLFGLDSNSTVEAATLVSGNYTSTHSIFELTAGDAAFTLDFFSPVSLDDYVRQSLPFSYLTITASPLNGNTPDLEVYSDIDDTWIGSPGGTQANHTTSDDTSIWQLNDPSSASYSQSEDENALWGTLVYAAKQANATTLQTTTGPKDSVRESFFSNGYLGSDSTSWVSGDVAGFVFQVGTLSATTSLSLAVGVVREEAINYLGAAQTGYYRSQYNDTVSAVLGFFDDYDAAASEAASLDSQISSTAVAVSGQNYSDILSLSLRQIFGGIDLTIPLETLSTSNPYAFIKEISSDGNVNTVDIIFSNLPFFYTLAPDWIKFLLEPITEYLNSGSWPKDFAIHDIGTDYPNATGHDDGSEEDMPVEESGNLLILAYAYQKATNDTSWAEKYTTLFNGYADYLSENGLYPAYQYSANDGLGEFANMTNLGVKATVGLAAHSALYSNSTTKELAASFVPVIDSVGLGLQTASSTGGTYYTLTYGDTTWFLTFNIYPDVLLDLGVFPDSIYSNQSAFYPTVRQELGVPIDGSVQWGKTDWQMWVAGANADESTTTEFINDLHAFIVNGQNTMPFSDRYYTSGDEVGVGVFRARPTVGGHWGVWATSSKK